MLKLTKCCVFILILVATVFCQQKVFAHPNHLESSQNNITVITQHDGLARKYIVHIPVHYDDHQPTPVVLAFHGGAGNADAAAEYFEMESLADNETFFIVYPEGFGKDFAGKHFGAWNAGLCCGDAKDDNVDDVGFVSKVLDEMIGNYNIDENRIYATGFSNGAHMSFRLACELSDRIAAIAPGGSVGTFQNCNPHRPVPVYMFSGTEDKCSPYEGGESCGGCISDLFNSIGIPIKEVSYRCEAVDSYADRWRRLNGCLNEYAVSYEIGDTQCITYQGCENNAEVTSCKMVGGGHSWPGKKEFTAQSCKRRPNGYICRRWKETVGPLIPYFEVNHEIWEFFKRHPKVN